MLGEKINDYEICVSQYFNEIKNNDSLSREEEKELFRKYREEGDQQAREKILKANLKFVVSLAKKYKGKGLPFADLISEGNLGMITAIDKFDTSRGTKFISYAVWWIRQAMLEAIEKRNSLPAEDLPTENQKESQDMDESDDDKGMYNDLYIDSNGHYDKEKAASVQTALDILMQDLTPRENKILSMYEGLNGEKERTLEEIGAMYGLTKERVRQINEKSMKKMCSRALMENVTSDVYR